MYEGWRWPSFDAGADAMRTLAQAQLLPTVLRLSDENETALNLADPDSIGGSSAGGCLMIVGFEGTPAAVAARRAAVAAVLERPGRRAGRRGAGPEVGPPAATTRRTSATRCSTPACWSRRSRPRRTGRACARTYDAVSAALTEALGEPAMVLCHVSHVYETGASLYFTVAAPEGDDALGPLGGGEAAAMDAIVDTDATITHHHAVGTDHQPWLEDEIGRGGGRRCSAPSRGPSTPSGILNPGVLVPVTSASPNDHTERAGSGHRAGDASRRGRR